MKLSVQSILKNSVAVNSATMFIGTMATNFGAYLYHVVVGRIMGPEQYGELAALFSILFLVSVPANAALTVITKMFSELKAVNDLPQAKALFLAILRLLFVVGVVGFVLFGISIPSLQHLLHVQEWQSFVWLYGIFVTFLLITVCMGALNGFQRFFPSTVFSTLNMVLRLITGILFAASGVSAALFGSAIANIFSLIFFFIPMRFLLKQRKETLTVNVRQAIKYIVPTTLVLLAVTMLYNLDVVLVKHFFSAEDAGIYGSITIFGKIVFFASTAILLAVFPMVVERFAKKGEYKNLVRMGLVATLVISAGIVGFYAIFSTKAAVLLFGKQFEQAGPYLALFGLFMAGVSLVNYTATMCLAINKSGIWKVVMIGASIQLGAIWILHGSLLQVIWVNIAMSWTLALAVLLYYAHAR